MRGKTAEPLRTPRAQIFLSKNRTASVQSSHVTEFIQHTIDGISLGAIYALIALGYTLVFGILQFINFAHSEIFMLGSYAGFYIARYLSVGADEKQGLGWFMLVLFLSMITTAVVGFFVEKLAYRPLRRAPRINVLITAVGVSLLFQFGGQMLFGPNPRPFPELMNLNNSYHIGDVQIDPIQIVVLGVAIFLMLVLEFILFRTKVGKAMRAVSHDHNVALLLGVNVDFIISLTFVIGSALAGAGGVLFGMAYPKIEPLMGTVPGIKSFVAAVFGGIGNVRGAVVGALIMGLSEQYIVVYGLPPLRDAVAYLFLIGILLLRPKGLFGKTLAEKV
jgi:branched-chain amino acid transport system permease protein